MKQGITIAAVVLGLSAGTVYFMRDNPVITSIASSLGLPTDPAAGGQTAAGDQGRGGQAGRRGGSAAAGRGAGGARPPMTVETGQVTRAAIGEQITVVGNLIADATVSVVPRAAGRLQEIDVRLGDKVARGQRIAKIEDFELIQQVKQAEAAHEVALATIRQRDADLKLAETNAERSRNLFQRQLLPKQTLDDTEARYQSAIAQLDLARAQLVQSKARLDELQITLANTVITSPVNGFVSRREVDPGAYVSQNVPVADVVDITRVRLVANIVEKDLRLLQPGNPTEAQVDAFPGATFKGRIARVSPVLDPTTRTAPIEIEIPNGDYRLRPGMYARVGINTGLRKNALVVPANALVDLGGRRGVFVPRNDIAVFRIVQVGLEQTTLAEVLGGLEEHEQVITTGSAALRDGDRILLPSQTEEPGGRRGRSGAETAAARGVRGGSDRGGSPDTGRGAP
jgi:membrane fusion protein, multidrug efflux system